MQGKDHELDEKWENLLAILKNITGKIPDLNGVLFLIGVQELGRGTSHFSKEEKQDLMHIATCKVLSLQGFYSLEGVDAQGWPHWKRIKMLPGFDLLEQEKLLKMCIIDYFEQEKIIVP